MSPLSFAAASSLWWLTIGVPLANHLWQSTLFAGVVGLLILLLKNNHARTRHWLWMLASAKFLIPFSLLVAIGSRIGWSRTSANQPIEFLFLMQGLSQPFSTTKPMHTTTANAFAVVTRAFPAVLALVWFCGFLAVLFYWWSRSRDMRGSIRGAQPVGSGREFEALRRLEQRAGIRGQIQLILTETALEPGILGIFRPVLLLPSGISERLTDAQLEAIVCHELCHVRRRDNLAAALHMLVEALFWFHPLVWWLGARLVDERERACDEQVLRLGSDPQTYAESILKICEFYLESPLPCAAGVTGSNLKKRIETIMLHRTPQNLDFVRKMVLSSVASLAVVVPVVFGLLHATKSRAQSHNTGTTSNGFESVYLQPNTTGEPMAPFVVYGRPMKAVQFKGGDNFLATNFSLRDLIQLGFKVQTEEIVGGPNWLDSEKYDVNAKLSSAELEKRQSLTAEQRSEDLRTRIQALLSERFKLVVHRETKTVPVYALVDAENGSQPHPAKPGDSYADGLKDRSGRPLGPGALLFPESNKLVAQAIPIKSLTGWLGSQELGRVVLDKTGLVGSYDIALQLPAKSTNYWSQPVLTAALEQQLGLKLDPQDSPVEVLVIDNAEKPAASTSAPSAAPPTPPKSTAAAPSANKLVLSDLKIEGDIPDREAVQARILNAWANREYSDPKELLETVPEVGVRDDFQSRGYFKVVVSNPTFQNLGPDSNGRQRLALTVSVAPGVQYRLGTFTVKSATPGEPLAIRSETLREQFHLKSGDLFKVSEIRLGMEKSMGLYHSKGYAEASVQPATSINEVQHLINFTLLVTEGPHRS
jgi:uncharacterized protein (TIGR03435 family)